MEESTRIDAQFREEWHTLLLTDGDCTYSLMTRSGAKQSMLPLQCWQDLQPRLKDMRKSQEHCKRVIWSSRCKFLKPEGKGQTLGSTRQTKLCSKQDRQWRPAFTNLVELWPTWQQKWPADPPVCLGWSWGGWTCLARCCHSRRKWSPAQWLSAGTTWWERAEACTWGRVGEPPLGDPVLSAWACCSAGHPSAGSSF